MTPTVVILLWLGATLLLSLPFDRRRTERDWRAEENSAAAGFKKWLGGRPQTSHAEPSIAPEPKAPEPKAPEPELATLRVSGSVSLEALESLGAALLANLPSSAQANAAVDVSFAIDANQARGVAANLSHLISVLDLAGLRIARVDPPRKTKPVRLVIRFRDLNPLLQSLLRLSMPSMGLRRQE